MSLDHRASQAAPRRDASTARRAWAGMVAACLLAVGLPATGTEYVQAPGSTLTFATRYQGEVFSGHFSNFRTRLSFDPQQLGAARLDVLIGVASAITGNEDRDQTLHGPDFFDSRGAPQARYRASAFRHLGDNLYAADGTLHLHGRDQPVTLTFRWTPGAHAVLSGKATLQRLDFGIGAGDWGDLDLIPNAVAVSTRVLLMPAETTKPGPGSAASP